MKKHSLLPTLLSAAIVCGAATAFATGAGAQQMNAETPKMPEVNTTGAMQAEPSISPNQDGNTQAPVSITTMPVDPDMSVIVTPVLEVPKADSTIVDKLISHHNNKEVEDIISMFSKEGFVKVRNNGHVIKNAEDMRKELVDFFAGDKKHIFTSQVDMVKDLAPGVALITSHFTMSEEGNTTKPADKMYGITVIKYEDNAWKIVASESTDIAKEMDAVEPAQHNGSSIKLTIVALIGIAIGFLGSRFLPKKAQ